MAQGAPWAHWQGWYAARKPTDVSWYQPRPTVSLDMIHASGVGHDAAIVDAGGGASTLAETLLAEGYRHVTVVDLAASALRAAQARLGPAAGAVEWVVADLLRWRPGQRFDLWHDRAVLHFLIDPTDRAAYLDTLRAVLRRDGQVILAAFAPDGPDRCSGLPVRRYDTAMMAELLGPDFVLRQTAREDHRTPAGAVQSFVYARFSMRSPAGASDSVPARPGPD